MRRNARQNRKPQTTTVTTSDKAHEKPASAADAGENSAAKPQVPMNPFDFLDSMLSEIRIFDDDAQNSSEPWWF
jgi:hypothetical protein